MKRFVLGAIAALLLAGWLWHALDRYAAARQARADALAATRMPSVTADALLPAADAADAQRLLARLIGDAASSAGVRLSLAPLPPRLDGLASTRIEAHGAEDRLRAFALLIEAPASPLRLVSWSIAADGAGALRLAGEAAAPWKSRIGADTLHLPAAPAAPPSPARTLFAADAPPDARPAADAPPELVGIAGRLPDDAVALVRLPDGSTRDLRVGETANGWTLARIAADRAGFSRGSQQREVVLPPRD